MGPVKSIAAVLRRWREFRRPSPEAPHLALGREGERLAARHLRQHRYKILYRNYRGTRGGEIDLVCRDRSCNALVFIEVKTRTNEDRGRPLDAVDRKKQRRIVQGALSWL
ncbi:MAG: YraN family protein, partial [Chthoniobacterales bacterium]